ncbi:hypothetical protein R1flu_026877 [Riccia fluitans]|uniref:Uncharacterized protein n=1 Tax=Riccia fluitans TaxID=41844 RepID=A0ABD1XH58_9MARC
MMEQQPPRPCMPYMNEDAILQRLDVPWRLEHKVPHFLFPILMVDVILSPDGIQLPLGPYRFMQYVGPKLMLL